MIVATPIDFPKIEPDDWNIFWEIWRSHSANIKKIKSNTPYSAAPVNSTSIWRGLDIYSGGRMSLTWEAPYYDISNELPKLHNLIKSLPFKHIERVRLIESLGTIDAHSDDHKDLWSIRAMFHSTSPTPQWYYTKPNGVERTYLSLPEETNWFAYNDKNCWHGSDFSSDHPKIILQLYTLPIGLPAEILKASVEKYQQYCITL